MRRVVPRPLRRTLWRLLPSGLRRRVTARFVDRLRPDRLRRFRARHTPVSIERGWDGSVAIVVPCYNHAVHLGVTLESIAAQTYRPLRVIFVEDHSTDDTYARLQALIPRLPGDIDASLLRTARNSGQAAALNLGISQAGASLCMVLNDDDYLMHDAAEVVVGVLSQQHDLMLIGGTAIHFSGAGFPPPDPAGRVLRTRWPDYLEIPLTRYQPEAVARVSGANQFNITHSGSAFFPSAWRAAGGYYPDKSRRVIAFSDRDFQLRVASLFPSVCLEAPLAFWRSDSSVDARRNS